MVQGGPFILPSFTKVEDECSTVVGKVSDFVGAVRKLGISSIATVELFEKDCFNASAASGGTLNAGDGGAIGVSDRSLRSSGSSGVRVGQFWCGGSSECFGSISIEFEVAELFPGIGGVVAGIIRAMGGDRGVVVSDIFRVIGVGMDPECLASFCSRGSIRIIGMIVRYMNGSAIIVIVNVPGNGIFTGIEGIEMASKNVMFRCIEHEMGKVIAQWNMEGTVGELEVMGHGFMSGDVGEGELDLRSAIGIGGTIGIAASKDIAVGVGDLVADGRNRFGGGEGIVQVRIGGRDGWRWNWFDQEIIGHNFEIEVVVDDDVLALEHCVEVFPDFLTVHGRMEGTDHVQEDTVGVSIGVKVGVLMGAHGGSVGGEVMVRPGEDILGWIEEKGDIMRWVISRTEFL